MEKSPTIYFFLNKIYCYKKHVYITIFTDFGSCAKFSIKHDVYARYFLHKYIIYIRKNSFCWINEKKLFYRHIHLVNIDSFLIVEIKCT